VTNRSFARFVAAFFIVAILLFLALPLVAKAGEPDMGKVCRVVAAMTAKACYRTALPMATTDNGRGFIKLTCNLAGDSALATCLNPEAVAEYDKLPTCAGLAKFTYDSVIRGGLKAVENVDGTEYEKQAILGFTEEWAEATSVNLFNECKAAEKKPEPKKAKPLSPKDPLDEPVSV
jgi:hypothetical protein